MKAEKAPMLLLPPSLSCAQVGPMLERVELVRDEAANLAWGIERFVEGPTGRAVYRLQHWLMVPASTPAMSQSNVSPTEPLDDDLEPPPNDLQAPARRSSCRWIVRSRPTTTTTC